MKMKLEYMRTERRSYFNKKYGRKDSSKVRRKHNTKSVGEYKSQKMKHLKPWILWEKIKHSQLMG